MLANEGSNRPYPEIGVSMGHHDASHHGGAAAEMYVGEDPLGGDAAASHVVRVGLPAGTDLARFAAVLADRIEGC
ncbi:MAG: hypothetical protein ACKOFI_06455, partial [Phycisphaerales bacterium]